MSSVAVEVILVVMAAVKGVGATGGSVAVRKSGDNGLVRRSENMEVGGVSGGTAFNGVILPEIRMRTVAGIPPPDISAVYPYQVVQTMNVERPVAVNGAMERANQDFHAIKPVPTRKGHAIVQAKTCVSSAACRPDICNANLNDENSIRNDLNITSKTSKYNVPTPIGIPVQNPACVANGCGDGATSIKSGCSHSHPCGLENNGNGDETVSRGRNDFLTEGVENVIIKEAIGAQNGSKKDEKRAPNHADTEPMERDRRQRRYGRRSRRKKSTDTDSSPLNKRVARPNTDSESVHSEKRNEKNKAPSVDGFGKNSNSRDVRSDGGMESEIDSVKFSDSDMGRLSRIFLLLGNALRNVSMSLRNKSVRRGIDSELDNIKNGNAESLRGYDAGKLSLKDVNRTPMGHAPKSYSQDSAGGEDDILRNLLFNATSPNGGHDVDYTDRASLLSVLRTLANMKNNAYKRDRAEPLKYASNPSNENEVLIRRIIGGVVKRESVPSDESGVNGGGSPPVYSTEEAGGDVPSDTNDARISSVEEIPQILKNLGRIEKILGRGTCNLTSYVGRPRYKSKTLRQPKSGKRNSHFDDCEYGMCDDNKGRPPVRFVLLSDLLRA